MSWENEEVLTFQMRSLHYRATVDQARAIEARLVATEEWRAWRALDYLVGCGTFDALGQEGRRLCFELADAERSMVKKAAGIIAQTTGCQ